MKINVSGVASEEQAKNLPEGTYEFQVGTVTIKDTRAGDKQQLVVPLRATDHNFALYDSVFDRIMLPVDIDELLPDIEKGKLEQMNQISRRKMQMLWKSAGATLSDDGLDTADIDGRVVKAVISHRSDENGNIRTNVVRYLAD